MSCETKSRRRNRLASPPHHACHDFFFLGADAPASGGWRAVLRHDRFCSYCGRRQGIFTVDHIDPVSEGGDWCVGCNGTCSCEKCNRDKGSTPLLSFLLDRIESSALGHENHRKLRVLRERLGVAA